MSIAAIGLGSNLHYPLQQLRKAVTVLALQVEIKMTAYSSIYISEPLLPELALPHWKEKPFLNAVIKVETSLTPRALLDKLKSIEKQLGRVDAQKWAPRIIDLDLLWYENVILNEKDLTLPHAGLFSRPFVLLPLLEVLPDFTIQSPSQATLPRLPHQLIGPQIVGVLNITPDSFSDGGRYLNAEKALQHAQKLFAAGADIIDIGAESTRPGANLINPETEWQRLEPVLSLIKEFWAEQEHYPLISIDTRHACIIERASEYGIDWVNAVNQCQFKAMVPLLKENRLRYVAMMNHGKNFTGSDQVLQGSVLAVLRQFKESWQDQFEEAGLDPGQLILDPGIGFGKSPAQNLTILQNMQQLQSADTQWLVGHSRKSFILKLWPESADLDQVTAKISANLSQQGVHYLRVHEPHINLSSIQSIQRSYYA